MPGTSHGYGIHSYRPQAKVAALTSSGIMNRIMANVCLLTVVALSAVVDANVPGQFPEENLSVYENADNEIGITTGKRSRGLDPMDGMTFGGMKKRFDALSGSSFGSQKRDGNFDNDQSQLRGFIRKNMADVTAANSGGQLTGSGGAYEEVASDSGRSAFAGLPKQTLHPYYVQSIPLPLFYRLLRDAGI